MVKITGSWDGTLLIYGTFLASAASARLVASPLAGLFARVEAAEGDLRRAHVDGVTAAEEIFLSGGAALQSGAEAASLSRLLALRWRLVGRQLALNALLYAWDYAGSLCNGDVTAM